MWKNWRRARLALKRPSTRRRAKSPRTKGLGLLKAETRWLFGGSSGPGPYASSWMAPRFHGSRLYGSHNEDRRPSQRGQASFLAKALQQPFLLPRDMEGLRATWQPDLFMSLKRDMAMVSEDFPYSVFLFRIYLFVIFF